MRYAESTRHTNSGIMNTVWNHGNRTNKISARCTHDGGMRADYIKFTRLETFCQENFRCNVFKKNLLVEFIISLKKGRDPKLL